jgi:hypothetical protein
MNRAQQAATKWSEAARNRAIERLELDIHLMTLAKCKVFNELLQHNERQLLQEVGTKATSRRSTFAKNIAQMKTTAEEEVYGLVNMTANRRLELQVGLSDAETEAPTLNITDTDHDVSQLE